MNRFSIFAFAWLVCFPAVAGARMEELGGTIELFLGPVQPGQDRVSAALVVDLKPGFKTYWMRPGDSGVPTQVGFDGSLNVAQARLRFPVPTLHEQPGDRTASYKGRVVFPVEVERIDPTAPIQLRATGMLGMCAEICIPVPIDLSASSADGTDPSAMPALFAGLEALPREAVPGIGITNVELVGDTLRVTAEGPNVRPRPVLFLSGEGARDLPVFVRASADLTFTIPIPEGARAGPLDLVLAFGTAGVAYRADWPAETD